MASLELVESAWHGMWWLPRGSSAHSWLLDFLVALAWGFLLAHIADTKVWHLAPIAPSHWTPCLKDLGHGHHHLSTPQLQPESQRLLLFPQESSIHAIGVRAQAGNVDAMAAAACFGLEEC